MLGELRKAFMEFSSPESSRPVLVTCGLLLKWIQLGNPEHCVDACQTVAPTQLSVALQYVVLLGGQYREKKRQN